VTPPDRNERPLAKQRLLAIALGALASVAAALFAPTRSHADFTTQVVDDTGNVIGWWVSLEVEADGTVHVSYFAPFFQSLTGLRYAVRSGGAWTRQSVALQDSAGHSTSIALDASGNPHISHHYLTNDDLRYSEKVGGVWTTVAAESPGMVGQASSLELTGAGFARISHYDEASGDLRFSMEGAGGWATVIVDQAGLVGFSNSLELDASGNPHIAYHDFTNGNLKYARMAGGVWTIETADGSANLVGDDCALALDASGNPHVSYYDETTEKLRYARKSGGVWTRETVDPGLGNVGSWTSIIVDANGDTHVSHYNDAVGFTRHDLLYSRKSGGLWTTTAVDTAGNVGRHSAIDLDISGNPMIAYHDDTNGRLKLAFVDPTSVSPAFGAAARLTVVPNPSRGDGALLRLEIGGGVDAASPGGGEAPGAVFSLFDVSGRLVRTLRPEIAGAASASARWDGRDARGRTLPPGVYLLRAGDGSRGGSATARVTIVR
jgi:hypothetical protein